jgi:hypothetical protein
MVTNVTARSLFLTGLTENMRTLMMHKTTGTLREAINEAAKQGKLLKNKGKFKTQISALCNMEDEKLEEQDLDEETVSKINHARARHGRQPYQKQSTTSETTNKMDKESNLEVTTTTTATRTETSRTEKTGSAVIAMPPATCKQIAGKEILLECLWWTDMANLLGETTRPFMKLNQKKEANSWDTSDNLREKVAVHSRIKII